MKKGILLVMFALLSLAGFSQVSWNAKVGMNISNFTGDLDVVTAFFVFVPKGG